MSLRRLQLQGAALVLRAGTNRREDRTTTSRLPLLRRLRSGPTLSCCAARLVGRPALGSSNCRPASDRSRTFCPAQSTSLRVSAHGIRSRTVGRRLCAMPPLAVRRESRHDALDKSTLTAMCLRFSFLALCLASSHAAVAADQAASAPAPNHAEQAGARCEQAVAETVTRMRGRDAKEVNFVAARRVVMPATEGQELTVRGEGSYRERPGNRGVGFSYQCAFDLATGATSGVMFRDEGDPSARREQVWEPDLTQMSPEVCETAAAAHLKEKYPRIGRIAFGSDTRRLRPAPSEHTSLEGQGALQRAPGMNSVPFTYRCEFESTSGRLVGVQTFD